MFFIGCRNGKASNFWMKNTKLSLFHYEFCLPTGKGKILVVLGNFGSCYTEGLKWARPFTRVQCFSIFKVHV